MNSQHEIGDPITLPSGRVTTLTDRASSANLWMAAPIPGGWALRRRSPDNATWIFKLGAPNMPEVWEEDDAFALIRALNATRPVPFFSGADFSRTHAGQTASASQEVAAAST